MLPLNLTIFVASSLFIGSLCNAYVSEYSFLDTEPDWRYADLKKRQNSEGNCNAPQCSPTECGGGLCTIPTDSIPNDFKRSLDLAKRIFTFPEDEEKLTIYLEAAAERKTAATLVPTFVGNDYCPSFCIQIAFINFPARISSIIGMNDTALTGCTILCVVSSRAVYMCHIWEDIHFATGPNPRGARYRDGLGIQPFINLISGNGLPTPLADGPALDPTLFNGGNQDNTWGFIMTPRARATVNDPNSQEHPAEIQQIVAVLRQRIPGIGLQFYNYWTNITHNPASRESPYQFGFQGVALFQYDPNADGNGNANWRLWFEASNENGTGLGQAVI